MPKFTNDDVIAAMENPLIIRNIATVGAMGIGKTCALDCLGAQCGIISADKISEARFALARQDERDRGCTLKMNVTSMIVEDLLLHVMDTPGHAEHAAEFSATLPLADGALVVVDGSGGGMATQTHGQVRELVNWAVEPVLFCNRLDISLFVTQKSPDEIATDLAEVVQEFSTALETMSSPLGEMPRADAVTGNVLFGSLAQGWAFTVPQMAETYASKFGVEVAKMSERLWGDHYFKPSKKTWTTVQQEGSVRGLVQFILRPIVQVAAACMANDVAKLEKMMGALGVTMTAADKLLEEKFLFRSLMQKWMPAGLAITQACQRFVPHPLAAQARRFPVLSTGPVTDPSAQAVRDCSPAGPLHFQIVKMIPQPGNASRFNCIGRVFSGTITTDKYIMVQEDYVPAHAEAAQDGIPAEDGVGDPEEEAADDDDAFPSGFALPASGEEAADDDDAAPVSSLPASPVAAACWGSQGVFGGVLESPSAGSESPSMRGLGSPKAKAKAGSSGSAAATQNVRVQGLAVCATRAFNSVKVVPAGNICSVSGIDQFVAKRGTLATSADVFPLRAPVFKVSPVVRMSVQPADVKDLPKMVDGLRRLSKSCPLVQVSSDDTGGHIVAGCGEEHMRVLQRDLGDMYLAGVNLTWGAPRVSYREVVTAVSSQVCLAKSPNKHNRLYITAEPTSEEFCQEVEAQRIFPTQDSKKRGKLLEKLGWEKVDTAKIWGFGPAPEETGGAYGPNVLVDQTKGCQYLNEIKESVNSGLLWASKQGPLCDEKMRGIKFNLQDVKLHADSIHRGMGQIQPPARRVLFSSILTAQCRLSEPVFLAIIEAPDVTQPGIMQALGACRGELVVAEEAGFGRICVQAYVPIAETIGATPFATVLTQKTNGKAAVSYNFDHWETMPSDPLAFDPKKGIPMSKAATVLMTVREQKGMKLEPPLLADFLDKL